MKKIILLVALCIGLVGCESSTQYGQCVGLGDKQDQSLIYKPSIRNIALGVIFSEMVIPPIVVAVDEFYCPVGKLNEKSIN